MIRLLTQLIDAAAQRHPEQPALSFGGQALSYEDLAGRIHKRARLLAAEGVRRGDRVGIYLPKGLEAAVSLYAIMKAGAAYVPLDPMMPVARLASLIRQCGMTHLCTDPRMRRQLDALAAYDATPECCFGLNEEESPAPCRCIPWEAETSQSGADFPGGNVIEQDLAYIIFTSASTGEPKGIMHTHYSGLSFARCAGRQYGLSPSDRVSNHAPLHFDLSTFDYFSSAWAAATTVIASEALTRLPASYSQWLSEERISVWYTVPFALVQLNLRGALAKRDLSALRRVLFAGEPMPPKHLSELMRLLPETRFSNIYGPAETNGCTFYNVPEPPVHLDDSIPIGRAFDPIEVVVADDLGQIVEPGEAGELWVRGPTNMRGYWRREDLNAQAFARRSIAPNWDDWYYRTGDLARLDPNGNLVFLGRKDRQVKIRGYRVELDEIELAITAQPEVEEAAVFPVDQEGRERILHAAVIRSRDTDLTLESLRRRLTERLPAYAVPTSIMFVDSLPRTSSGKIDRRSLRRAVEQDS